MVRAIDGRFEVLQKEQNTIKQFRPRLPNYSFKRYHGVIAQKQCNKSVFPSVFFFFFIQYHCWEASGLLCFTTFCSLPKGYITIALFLFIHSHCFDISLGLGVFTLRKRPNSNENFVKKSFQFSKLFFGNFLYSWFILGTQNHARKVVEFVWYNKTVSPLHQCTVDPTHVIRSLRRYRQIGLWEGHWFGKKTTNKWSSAFCQQRFASSVIFILSTRMIARSCVKCF